MTGNELWIVRHGPTEWSRSGRHTSATDLPLLEDGEDDARALGERLSGLDPALVLTSPRLRARRTAELAGFADAQVDDDLTEWGYGEYEGITTPAIREQRPGWNIWSDGCPGGESPDEVGARLDRVVATVLAASGPVIAFAHGHSLRVLTARWLGLPVSEGRLFKLDTATISLLGHERESPVVIRWNS
ncbi:histidine phosphatase family protein [Nocardioides sp. 1609]|uniref:histidine phosphatase family protein n=1 Tax=Nocardioides sp. 1609 TaxID=2508327 RepID=UPI001070163C|nr:histidine phosphatase family protein [Nocardioides sp. 1609]